MNWTTLWTGQCFLVLVGLNLFIMYVYVTEHRKGSHNPIALITNLQPSIQLGANAQSNGRNGSDEDRRLDRNCSFAFGKSIAEPNVSDPHLLKILVECLIADRFRRPLKLVPLCSCVPPGLSGKLKIIEDNSSLSSFDLQGFNNSEYQPSHCEARIKLSVIIPFRDRKAHLNIQLRHFLPILVRQQLHFRVFVIEQMGSDIFNRAILHNIGFLEANSIWKSDCMLFIDVDLLIENDFNLMRCRQEAVHVGAFQQKYKYRLPYENYFGGAVLIKTEHFQRINGVTNLFQGWGGEDDEFSSRVRSSIGLVRVAPPVGKVSMIRHARDKTNRAGRFKRDWIYSGLHDKMKDGLNKIKYSISGRISTKYYVLLQAHSGCVVGPALAGHVDGVPVYPKVKVKEEDCVRECDTEPRCSALNYAHGTCQVLRNRKKVVNASEGATYRLKACAPS